MSAHERTQAAEESDSTRAADVELVRGAMVGRYVVLAKLGAGAMGVVYAAYDPELDRKVALKLLHGNDGGSSEGRARLQREAQALAKLSHPNIVAVHDVGTLDERVWIAMEFVAGKTLRAWLDDRRRTWREVLDTMTTAGRGLAAAHEAGLVHRDFKPDNVMVGDDGRVRVMDFGLARAERSIAEPTAEHEPARVTSTAALSSEITRAGSVVGTPAYMAAEQHAGLPTDARTDQFALCVTMWEALYRQRPFGGGSLVELSTNVLEGRLREPSTSARVPRWLRKIVLRGLSSDAASRWPTMAALLEAFARGQARARARRVLAGTAVLGLAAGGVALAHELDVRATAAACEEAGASIAAIWNDAAREDLREGLVATGVSYAETTADKVMPWLDEQAQAWHHARTQACLDADVRGVWSTDTFDRSLWCLDERRMELEALVVELSRADATGVQTAVAAATGLATVDACRDASQLERLPPPPTQGREDVRAVRAELSRAGALGRSGKYSEGLAVAGSARQRAESMQWPPLLSAARAYEASLLEKQGSYEEAERLGAEAYFEAARIGAWDLAADAAATLIDVVGDRRTQHAAGLAWGRHAEVAEAHVGDREGLREAGRLGSLANVHSAKGDYAQARALHERALAIRENALGPDHPSVAKSLNNLATVHNDTGDHVQARALFERALVIWENALGADHPDIAATLNNLATVHQATGDLAQARAMHERALAIWEKALGSDHPHVAAGLVNLASMHREAGNHSQARAMHERALAIQLKALGPDHVDVAITLNNLANVHYETGDAVQGHAMRERALAILEKALGPDHPAVATTLGNLAIAYLSTTDATSALPLAERAVAIYEGHDGVQENELSARFALARALVASGGNRSRARKLAETARDGWRHAGGEANRELIDEVDAWLAAHRGEP